MTNPNIVRRIAIIMTLNFAARGFVLPYVNIYLDSLGFSGTQIGAVASLSALLDVFLMPFMLTISDRRGNHRNLYRGAIVATSLSVMGLVASIGQIGIGMMVILRDFTDKPNAVLAMQLTITKLEEIKRDIFGRLRAWGSLGWAMTTFISGYIFDIGGFALLFVLSGLLTLATLPFTGVFPTRTSGDRDTTKPRVPRRRGFYYLLVSEAVFWGAVLAYTTFIYIYMKNELGASEQLIGIAVSIGALVEVPVMVMIDYVLRRYDIRVVYLVGVIGLSLHMLAFALIVDATFIIPLMIMRGIFYSFQSIAKMMLIARISHPSNVSTNQALAQTTVPAIAITIFGPFSGLIYDNAGGATLFTILMVFGLFSAGFIMIMWRYLGQREASDTQELRAIQST